MDCEELRDQLGRFLSGKLSGDRSRAVRLHLASCSRCAGRLDALDRIEVLVGMDGAIDPSPDLHERFRDRLQAHHSQHRTELPAYRSLWRHRFAWSLPKQLSAAAALSLFLAMGIYLGWLRQSSRLSATAVNEISIAENLSLLKDMEIIRNLDQLEDFDVIQDLQVEERPNEESQ
jgi:anti-sigma factor RsiW